MFLSVKDGWCAQSSFDKVLAEAKVESVERKSEREKESLPKLFP